MYEYIAKKSIVRLGKLFWPIGPQNYYAAWSNFVCWKYRFSVPQNYRALKPVEPRALSDSSTTPPYVVWSRRPTRHRCEHSRRCAAIAVGLSFPIRSQCATFKCHSPFIVFLRHVGAISRRDYFKKNYGGEGVISKIAQ